MAPPCAASTRGVLPDDTGNSKCHFSGYDEQVRGVLVVIGVLLLMAGLVWVAQGLNLPYVPRSFMTSDRAWIAIGAVCAVAGVALIDRGRRRSRAGD